MYKIHFILLFIGVLISCQSATSGVESMNSDIEFAQVDSIPKPVYKPGMKPRPKPKPKVTHENKTHDSRHVDQPPIFLSDCYERNKDKQAQKECSKQAFLAFIEKNIQPYTFDPVLSKCILETTAIRFFVDKKGKMHLPKTYDLATNCIETTGLLLQNKKNEILWKPAIDRNIPVKVEVEMLLRIKKNGFNGFKIEIINLALDSIYEIVEEMPRFPGCEDIEGDIDAKKQCADQKMLAFIYKHVKYPTIIREGGVEGVVVIRFVVDEHGIIRIPRIIRDIGAGCGDNALKVVKMMNYLPQRWTPGKKDGKPVNVQFNLPVRYRLDG